MATEWMCPKCGDINTTFPHYCTKCNITMIKCDSKADPAPQRAVQTPPSEANNNPPNIVPPTKQPVAAPTKEKNNKILLPVVLLLAVNSLLLVVIFVKFAGGNSVSKKKTVTKPAYETSVVDNRAGTETGTTPAFDSDLIRKETPAPLATNSNSETTVDEEDIAEIGDPLSTAEYDEAMNYIRNRKVEIMDWIDLEDTKETNPIPGMHVYWMNDKIFAILLDSNAYRNIYYEEYYFDEDEVLTYTYLEAADRYSMYFKNNRLIHWIYYPSMEDDSGKVYHKLEASSETNTWREWNLKNSIIYKQMAYDALADNK